MAKKKAGKTEQAPEQKTVEVVHDTESLTQIIRDQMEVEEPPKEEKTPDEPSAEVEGEEGEEVLSQDKEDAAEAEPAAEDEPGEPEGEPEPEAEKDELPKGVRKRIDKLTAQKKAIAEEKDAEIANLRVQVDGLLEKSEQGKANPDRSPDPENPYRHLTSAEDIRREELNAEEVMDWCEDNPDGALVADGDKEREYTAEDVRDIRKRARKALSRQLPDQKQWLNSYHAVEDYAKDSFPWWEDKTTSEYQAAVQVTKVFPEVMRFSDYKVNIGDMIEGRKLRLDREAQTAKGKKKTAPPRAPEQPMAPVAEPAPVNQKTARSASARKAFSDSGNIDDLARIMVAEMD